MKRSDILEIIVAALHDQLEADGLLPSAPLTEETALIGRDSPVDSLGLVSVIVEVEQRLQYDHGVSLTLTDERAMSQRHSPFRTVATMADYALASLEEDRDVD
jgi:acyl carrier protein